MAALLLLLTAAPGLALPTDTLRSTGLSRDYRLGAPAGSLTLRAGVLLPRARSEIFDFATRHFTLGRGDFVAPLVSADLALRITDRVDLVTSIGYGRSSAGSEYRDWIDSDERPIEQVTRLTQVPVTASVKAYVTERAERVGQFAWIPTRSALYVGAGGGALWHRFEQEGSFVDFVTLDVFDDRIMSSGTTWTAHAFAGADYNLSKSLGLTGEARYVHGSAAMDAYTFSGFDRVDLSAVHFSVGLFVRF
jgi:hypothetical protein